MTLTSLTLIAAAGLVASPASAQMLSAEPLDRHLWRSRLLVVVAPDVKDERLAEQRRLYAAGRTGARERDLVLVEAAGRTGEAEALRRRFSVAPDAFAAILVGKDGGAKLHSERPLAPDTLFGEIDGMPMRQDEMRRAGSGGPRS